MEAKRSMCTNSSGAPIIDPTKVRSIFFDFDACALPHESRWQLDQLRTILKKILNIM